MGTFNLTLSVLLGLCTELSTMMVFFMEYNKISLMAADVVALQDLMETGEDLAGAREEKGW